jgi:hypothetical protein
MIVRSSKPSERKEGSNVITYERLQHGPYYADFRRDQRLHPEVYHCLVQRQGSTEILSWTQHRSLEQAHAAAQQEFQRLSSVAPMPLPKAAD